MKSRAVLLLAIFLFSIVPFNNVSANSSSDVMLAKPNEFDCLSDSILECNLPIDASLYHSWTFKAYNANVAEEYAFRMSVEDLANNVQVHTATRTILMAAYDVADVTFTPWNGWIDGGTYNISFSAVRTDDNSNVGNVRYFHATFEDTVDVAILSNEPASAIKQDLSLLGKTYTQFPIDDWPTYLRSGWMSNYHKIVIPSQIDYSAKPTGEGGDGYFEKLGDSANKSALESFMSAGGTVQIHLTSSSEHYEYSPMTEESNLPFNMDIRARNTAQTKVTFSDMEIANPYHPLFKDVDFNRFQGFDADGTVAEAVVDTKSTLASSIPSVCDGYSEHGGYFQRLIQTQADAQDTLLGTCNYGAGGMIVTTIDVERESERADSPAFPLLGNMLSHHLSAYPTGFGDPMSGTDMTLNGNIPPVDPTMGEYATMYLKSNEEIVFNYSTSTTEMLHTDWVIEGPTDWQGVSGGGLDHTNASSPSTTFCRLDISSETGCLQGATWEITLYLHDEHGNARMISVTVETNDVLADNFPPIADAQIDMRWEYLDNIEFKETKTVQNVDWDVYQITLQGEGDDAELMVHFDASNSSDPDALEGNGIFTYEWKVLFDAPYGSTEFDIEGHTFTLGEASGGMWSYNFKNITVDPTGTIEQWIRIELVVLDKAQKFSEKFRMYFVVVPEGFGDAEPEIQWDNLLLNASKYGQDTLTISGQVLSGAETNEVRVEAAFFEENFSESSIMKYTMMLNGLWGMSDAMGDNDRFEITLNLESFYTNKSASQRVYIKYYEGEYPNERWVTIKWIELTLQACQGLEVPENVLEFEPAAYWIWNADTRTCEWSGLSIDSDGDGVPDSLPDADGDGIPDDEDVFPFDANESKDYDLDGVGNNADAFPFDANETKDTDNDGVGDNGDAFPNDPKETADFDGDGVGDNSDAFPEDANETVDSDSDGVGDNSDVFPNDENESADSDGDGVGDNADAFPNNPSETEDSDGNGIGDNYQKQVEEELRNMYLISGVIGCVVILIGGLVYKQKRNASFEQLEKQFDFGNLPVPPLAQVEPTVTQQWTDESGYTWRTMSNGDTMWWDGTDWKAYPLQSKEN